MSETAETLPTTDFYKVVSTNEISTISSNDASQQSSDVAIIFIIVFILAAFLGVFYFIRYRRRKKKKTTEKAELGISTLGSLYEVHSLISLNKDDAEKDKFAFQVEKELQERNSPKKYSFQASSRQLSKIIFVDEEEKKCEDENHNPIVSEDYVDCSELIKPSVTITQEAQPNFLRDSRSLQHTTLNLNGVTRTTYSPSSILKPPNCIADKATPESLSSSSGSSTPEQMKRNVISPERHLSVDNTQLSLVKKDHQKGLDRTDSFRPYSQVILSKHMILRQKQDNLKQDSSSQDNLLMPDNLSKTSGKSFAKSESHLAHLPPVPPKIAPILPSKQKINKSREDLQKLNKEMLRTSMTLLSDRIEKIDEDYDFPAGMNDSIPDHELMDYDEPSFSYTQHSFDETSKAENKDA